MTTDQIEDTIECRKKILEYLQYLKDGQEEYPEDFMKKIIGKILSGPSLLAMNVSLQKLTALFKVQNAFMCLVGNTSELEKRKLEDDYVKMRNAFVIEAIKMEIATDLTRMKSEELSGQKIPEFIK